jgi:hypothetical protein
MSNQFPGRVPHCSYALLGNKHGGGPSIGSRSGDNSSASYTNPYLKRQLSKSAENNPRGQCRLRHSRQSPITEDDVLDFWFDRNQGKLLNEEDYNSIARVVGWEAGQILDWINKRERAPPFCQVHNPTFN